MDSINAIAPLKKVRKASMMPLKSTMPVKEVTDKFDSATEARSGSLGGGERGTEPHPLLPLRISAGLEPRRCSPPVLPAVLLLPSEDGDPGCRRCCSSCCCMCRWGVGVAGRPLCGRCWARTLASAVVGTSLRDCCRCCVVAPPSSAVEDDAVETSGPTSSHAFSGVKGSKRPTLPPCKCANGIYFKLRFRH